MPARDAADRLAGLQGLLDEAELLLVVTPSPPTLGAQHIDLHSPRDLKARFRVKSSSHLFNCARRSSPAGYLKPNANGFLSYTPATNLLYGLREAIAVLLEERLENVFARHQRLAAATRAAVNHWSLEVLSQQPSKFSRAVMPPGHDADQFRKVVLGN